MVTPPECPALAPDNLYSHLRVRTYTWKRAPCSFTLTCERMAHDRCRHVGAFFKYEIMGEEET